MANVYTSPWTAERTDRIRSLWVDGWSASQIAVEIGGATRNAVIGRLNRLGLRDTDRSLTVRSVRPKQRQTPGPKKAPQGWFTRPRPPRQRAKREPMVMPPLTPPTCEPVSFADLKHHHCRYPVTSEAPWRFCGAPKAEGVSYCAFHAELCFQPTRLTPKRTS